MKKIAIIVVSLFLVGVLLVSAAETKFGQVQKKRFGTNSVSGAAVSPMSAVTGAAVDPSSMTKTTVVKSPLLFKVGFTQEDDGQMPATNIDQYSGGFAFDY